MAPKLRLAHLKQEEPRLSSNIKYVNAGFEHETAQDGEIAADLAAWRAEPKAQGGRPESSKKEQVVAHEATAADGKADPVIVSLGRWISACKKHVS